MVKQITPTKYSVNLTLHKRRIYYQTKGQSNLLQT